VPSITRSRGLRAAPNLGRVGRQPVADDGARPFRVDALAREALRDHGVGCLDEHPDRGAPARANANACVPAIR
jgi:hypothetical protein